jgi:polyisoprenyl-phosphate glycosyltransferase
MQKKTLSIVAPVYNEEGCINEFYNRLAVVLQKISMQAEIIFVNDGSVDSSVEKIKMLRRKDDRVKILNFTRNFGHQIAIKAGIDHASGDSVVIIDSDLQDPPENIPELIEKYKEGYDVVYTVHAIREGESFFKKFTAFLYYRFIRKICAINLPLDSGDFRLISRKVADCLKDLHEKNIYLRGLISWLGFKQIGIPVTRHVRYAGKTKYPFSKMIRFAWNGITHFSFLPLQISTIIGCATSFFCLLWIIYAIYVSFVLRISVPGWTSIMVAVLFLGSVQLITLGIIGSYLARNYDQTRPRPLYIIQDKEGL